MQEGDVHVGIQWKMLGLEGINTNIMEWEDTETSQWQCEF